MSLHLCTTILRRTPIFSGELKLFQTTLNPQFLSTIPHHNLLPLSSSTKSLPQTNQLHAVAILTGHLPKSISVSAALILQYAAFGHPSTSQLLFHQSLPFSRSAFLWNTVTRALTIARVSDGVFSVYNLMIRSGIRPDDHTFPFVLKACSDCHEVWKGLEVHGSVLKTGFDSDLFVGNTLLRFYGECEGGSDAQKVFDEMPQRDVVSYNTLISVFSLTSRYDEAVGLFANMRSRRRGESELFLPNVVTVVTFLPVCAAVNDFIFTSEFHGYVFKTGFDSHVTVKNGFIDAYGKCGDFESCKRVFDETAEQNDVSWNSVITSFVSMDRRREAFEFFRFMIDNGTLPNCVAVSSMLPVLVDLGFFQRGLELHSFILRTGLESDVFVANSLLDMYAKFGHPIKASNVFNAIKRKNVISWNAMIANYAQNGLESLALRLIIEMQDHGHVPGAVTLTNVLPACGRIGNFPPGKQIHARSIRSGFVSELFVSNALIDMYAKCGRLDLACKVFEISRKDRISYNTLISAYSHTPDSIKSLILFRELFSNGLKPDTVSFSAALSACGNTADIETGEAIHAVSIKNALNTHLIVSNSILDLYAKSGNLVLAKTVFDSMPVKDTASWNTMITGYGSVGETDAAIGLFESMRPDSRDSITYLAVLTVCSRGGLVEMGRRCLEEMRDRGIEPWEAHYGCLVDLLGRAGLVEEAVGVIGGLAVEPGASVWGSLVGACRVHGEVGLGQWAGDHLLKVEPFHSGYYALVCNLYAEAGKWGEVDKVRELMKARGVKKNPGFSWAQK